MCEPYISIITGLVTGLISGFVATWLYDTRLKKKKQKEILKLLEPFLNKEIYGYWKNDFNPGKEAFIGTFTYSGKSIVEFEWTRIGETSKVIGRISMSHDLIGYGKGAYHQNKNKHSGFAFPEIWIVGQEIVMNAPYIKSANPRDSREWIPQAFVWTEKLTDELL